MNRIFTTLAPAALLCCSALFSGVATADSVAARPPASPPDSVEDQLVVRGRALADLRRRIALAEDAFYDRFNEINPDHRFDVHCYTRREIGSRPPQRTCMFDALRAEEAAAGDASGRWSAAETGASEDLQGLRLRAEAMQGADLVRRLAATDPVMKQEMVHIGQAYLALEAVTGQRFGGTLYREVPVGEEGLPYGAQRMFDVRAGLDPWTLPLDQRTFTITSVSGKIRHLDVECEHGGTKLEFENDAEWTLPGDWGACTLTVKAKRATTFRVVEFD